MERSNVPAMTSATQAYTYAAPSSLVDGRLGLATSGGRALSGPAVAPRFFSGVVTRTAPAAALLGVADVAPARYHQPQARPGWMRDPVVTCDGDRLRFESFSACGGVYARLDPRNGTLDGEVFDRGASNVDVNAPLLPNPRPAKGRKLVDEGAVHLEGELATVHTSGGARRVSSADSSCTCEWWWDHRGSRGPCEHVPAARIVARAAVAVSR